MEFGELYIGGFIDKGALSTAILVADLGKIRLLAPHTIWNESSKPNFQTMVVNGHSEAPIATV